MAKTSLDSFSLCPQQVWTYSFLGDRISIYEMKKMTRVRTAGDQIWEITFAVPRPLVNPAPTGNQTLKTTCSVLGPSIVAFYDQQRLLRAYSS